MAAAKQNSKPGTKPGATRGSYKTKPKRVPVTVRVLEDDEIFAEFAAHQHNVGLSLELMVRHFYQLYPELVGEDVVLALPTLTSRMPQPAAAVPVVHETQQQQQQKKNPSRTHSSTGSDTGDREGGSDAADVVDSAAANDIAKSTPEVEVENQGAPQNTEQQNATPQSTDEKLAAMRDAAFANPNDDVLAGLLDM